MEENNSSNGNGNGECKCGCHCNKTVSFPPGYRFNPTDEELVVKYLKKKLMKQPLPFNDFMRTKILELNIYKKVNNPEMLAECYKLAIGEKDWYFFTPRDRKYPNGIRPNRAAGIGYWKATGADKPVKRNEVIVGYRKSLVFYIGKPPKGEKTNWIMHEFRVDAPARKRTSSGDMKLDDWVLCRIYKKPESTKSKSKEEVETSVVTEGQSPVESALDQNQIHQGGNNDDDQQPIKIYGNLEMFKNRHVELHQSPFNPHQSYQTKLPLRNRSLAANIPLMKNVHYKRYNEDQRYVPMNEINYLFQPQQQQQQQTVSQTVSPVYSEPPSMYQHVEYDPNDRDDFHTRYTMESMPRGPVPQQPQHEWDQQQQYHQQSHEGQFLPMEYNPEFDETSCFLVTKDEDNFGLNIPPDIPRDPPYDSYDSV